MKTIQILVLFVGMLVSGVVSAQSGHRECAPGCISNQAQGKGRVTCIDEVCTICHEKQEKERKEKLEADKLAAQKRAQQAEQRKQQQTKLIADQRKQVAIQRQKAKENELVLVAPTPKIDIKKLDNKKTQILSKEDKEILDLAKTYRIDIEGFVNIRNVDSNNRPLSASYYDRVKDERIILKKIELEKPYEFYENESIYTALNNDGNFISISSEYNKAPIYRIVNLKGQVLFRNETGISYLDEGLYIISKDSLPYKEILNINTMKSFPFPEELITNWGGSPNKKNSTTNTNVPYNGFKISMSRYETFKKRGIYIYATWNLKMIKEKGYEFYPDKSYPGADQELPVSYLENKEKCISMFIFLHNIEDNDQTVNMVSIYGFDPTRDKFILLDRINYNLDLDYHHLFYKKWFGNLK
ncbi:hypothetical protein [Flavobacterium aurantiibacter]|uniref:Uncharacterized protein n=1 Tax=Flavobacterium aurantiibacter TaxID=2023067 RepID=A0A256AD19_9FLAO|nr:hypothetical protein [Flavobacterium aurantiibacter]OYQ51040.1 hypothetical protein CHX27_00515 [Flavobacterium aurantiibacter]